MPLPTFYATGTVSVSNGATTVTGSGTGWGGDVILAGDLFMDPAQPEISPQRIASVTDGTHLELSAGWPGADLSTDAYEIRFVGDIVRSTAQTRRYLEQLGRVQNTGIEIDAFGPLAERATWDDAAKSFAFLSTDGDGDQVETPVVYIKKTDADGDWSTAIPMGATVVQVLAALGVSNITVSTEPPSGGADGDLWFKVSS